MKVVERSRKVIFRGRQLVMIHMIQCNIFNYLPETVEQSLLSPFLPFPPRLFRDKSSKNFTPFPASETLPPAAIFPTHPILAPKHNIKVCAKKGENLAYTNANFSP